MSTPWNPSRPAAYLLGLVSLWPILYMMLFMSFMAFSFASMSNKTHEPGFEMFKYIFVMHFVTMLLMFVLTAIYVIHAYRSDQIEPDKRVLWVIILFFGNMLAFPIYWWLFVRPRPVVR